MSVPEWEASPSGAWHRITAEMPALAAVPRGAARPALTAWRARLAAMEDVAVAATLGLVALFPLAEMVARVLGTGVSGSHALVKHATLVVGMLGGAVAAREGRLLALSTAFLVQRGWLGTAARAVSAAVSATVAAFLCVAGIRFVAEERGAAHLLAYGLPVWVLMLAIPVGFALVALRIVRHGAATWPGRLAVAVTAGGLAWVAAAPPLPPVQLAGPAIGLLLLATLLGAPIFSVLGGAALILFWAQDVPIAAVTVEHYRLSTNAVLPAMPLFTLAGFILAESGAPRRLVRLFRALVGGVRGGPGMLTAVVCAFFTAFTGASGVTILALGGLLMPVLLAARYSERTSLGLLTGTGSLGLLLPPCLPLILYAVIAEVDIVDMFLGGVIPGILLIAMTAAWAAAQAPRDAAPALRVEWKEVRAAFGEAKWEVLTPVVALGSMAAGLATAVEAAALTAAYTFVVETVMHRDLRIGRDLVRVVTECGQLIGGLLLILGVALGFTNFLVHAEIPTLAIEWVTRAVHSPWVFLLLLNVFLIVVGALMDIYSALVIVVPLIVPMGRAFGIDPIHLGVVFLANAELGYLMPPVGENLFIAALRFRKPVTTVFRAVLPMVVVFLIAVLLITYVPALTTAFPRWLRG